MVISYITLLPIDNLHAVAFDIGIANDPIPVRLNVLELDVVAMITNLPYDCNNVVNVFYFFYLFLCLSFSSLKY